MSVWVGSGGGEVRQPTATTTLLSTNTSMESGIEAGVLPTVTGSLASARDSLGSLSRAAEPIYDTDHTDLGSELDEAEIRRELLHDKWRLLFDRFDPEGFGEIPWPDFIQTLKHPDFIAQVPPHKLEILLDKAQSATSDAITFTEFVNVETRSFCIIYFSSVPRTTASSSYQPTLSMKRFKSKSQYAKKRNAAVAELETSDEETEVQSCEREREQESIAKKKKTGKSKSTTKTNALQGKEKERTKSSLVSDLFGDDPEPKTTGQRSPLWSSISRSVADGVFRQVNLLEGGELFFDIKVYNTADIIHLNSRDRADKWTAQLRVQVDPDDPLWRQVKNIFREAKEKFPNEPVFYANKKI